MIPLPRDIRLNDQHLILPLRLDISPCSVPELPQDAISRFCSYYSELVAGIPATGRPASLPLSFILMPRIAASHKDMHLISITLSGLSISAKSFAGFLYGLATLKQLVYKALTADSGRIPCGQIIDYPAYEYRGLLLDESRHFFGKKTLFSLLDYMADLKFNYLHWHLSDDQGWRVESRKYPRLNEISSWRTQPDGSRYGGYYAQDDLREVQIYAASRGISIIPEFDFPGHSLALLAAYPALACKAKIYEVANSWGVFEDLLCVGKDGTLGFVQDLLAEFAALFDAPYFHIGGDEVPITRWQHCPDCRSKLKELQLKDYTALQGWFTDILVQWLKQLGKVPIAWDEVLDSPVDKSLIAMLWRGDALSGAARAAASGNRYILCPNSICYLDWKAGENLPGAHGVSSLENVYGINVKNYPGAALCLGLQGNLWTEYMRSAPELYTMLHPRAVAIAERAWNPGSNYPSFTTRLKELEAYFAALS